MMHLLRFLRGHPLTRDHMAAGVARLLRYQLLTRTRREVILPWIDGAKLVVRRHTPGASGNFYTGLHEYSEMGFLLHFLRPGDLFADVGANVGTWTILASRVCGARTIAFEPDPQTAAYLRRTIDVNGIGDKAEVREVAVGEADGSIAFTVGKDTENRIARPGDENVREVPVRRLSVELTEVPTFIKMDVEGFEEGVMRGAGALLADPALRALSTELCTPWVASALAAAGLERVYYDPGSRALTREPNGLVAHNSLFVRDFDEAAARLRDAPRRRVYGNTI